MTTNLSLRRLFAALCVLSAPLHAQTSTWTGTSSLDKSWANAANWNNGLPSTDPLAPSKVVIGNTEIDATALILGGLDYYLNSLTMTTGAYTGTSKTLASGPGSIHFAALDGIDPTVVASLSVANKSILLSSNIVLDKTLTITRNGTAGSGDTRNLVLNGVISGDGGLILNNASNSGFGRININGHNTFTGDVVITKGYATMGQYDAFGAPDKTVSVATTGLVTLAVSASDLNSVALGNGTIGYDFDIGNINTDSQYGPLLLIFDGTANRKVEFTGNITGPETFDATKSAFFLIAQGDQQIIFSGENSTVSGRIGARYGTEMVLAGANANNVAWENVDLISLGRQFASTVTAKNNNSAFVLRGNYTFNGGIEITKRDAGASGEDLFSIGQVNTKVGTAITSHQAVFNGNIDVQETDYRTLNLVSETGGSATFNGQINILASQGMNINKVINANTSNATATASYGTTPTGVVVLGSTSRVSATPYGTDSIGTASILNGTLAVNTDHFYGDINVANGTRLAGTGIVNGNVTVQTGGRIEPGFGNIVPSFTSTVGALEITGNVSLTGTASILFQAAGASFNLNGLTIETLDPTTLAQLGNHDFLSIGGNLSLAQSGTLSLQFIDGYLPNVGDVFHLADFTSISFNSAPVTDAASLWALPDLSSMSLFWNYDYFLSDGYLIVGSTVTSPLSIWNGAANPDNNSWAASGNWSSDVPSTNLNAPSRVVFANNDLNAHRLTLDGTYYLNSLTVSAADYGANEKELAAPGLEGSKLVFKSSEGVDPTLNVTTAPYVYENGVLVNTTRNLVISADIELQDDLTINREGVGNASNIRRLLLNGNISGDGGLTLNLGASGSHGERLELNGHNTFTGDIYFTRGYLYQTWADGLGAFGNTLYFGLEATNWDLQSPTANHLADGSIVALDYNLHFSTVPSNSTRTILIQAGNLHRQLELSGDITGGIANTQVSIIAQTNQQLIFSGENMDFSGTIRARYGSEIVLANANPLGVAWENVISFTLGDTATASGSFNAALVLRGDYTFNSTVIVADTTNVDMLSLGQINHQGAAYDATFNGLIDVREKDNRSLNLVSENGGSATFKGPIAITGAKGMEVNRVINTTTSGGTYQYYEALPTGTVILHQDARVASTSSGTGSIGVADIRNGTLVVNTRHFYGDASVDRGARLGGLGKINGNVTLLGGSLLEPGYGFNDLAFTSPQGRLTVTGSVTLAAEAGIQFLAAGASFNIGQAVIDDIASLAPETLEQLGLHSYLSVGTTLSIADAGALRLEFINDYLPSEGDVFHLLDYANIAVHLGAATRP
jgi:hypothetical protein